MHIINGASDFNPKNEQQQHRVSLNWKIFECNAQGQEQFGFIRIPIRKFLFVIWIIISNTATRKMKLFLSFAWEQESKHTQN